MHLELEGIAPSIGSVGDAYDNGLMASIIGLFKTECIATTAFHDGPYKTSPTSNTPPPAGSTGTTTDACTAALACSSQPNTNKPTTLLSTKSRNPHERQKTRVGSNTTDGVHVASTGGVWICLAYGFGGMRDYNGVITFDPGLPESWAGITFQVSLRGSRSRST